MRIRCGTSVLVALLLFGCRAGEVELYEPEGSGLGVGLTVKVDLEAAAAEIGEALSWTDGVPEAEVRVHRLGTEFSWQTVLTDASGVAEFRELLPGSYRVAGYRVLTDEEVEQVGGRRRALGDGRIIAVSGPRTVSLTVMADQRGSLLIGELYGSGGSVPQYFHHYYLEVYNNSDTAINLDGKILGRAYDDNRDYSSWTCDQSAVYRVDPDGIWSRFFYQFPGSGAEYPLAPGEIAVVAVDAVDHSGIHPDYPDLRQADFELFGPGDVDNPAVPNMPEIGTAIHWGGHGMWMQYRYTYFLSGPVDVEALPRMRYAGGTYEYARLPREALLDVLASAEDFAYADQQWPLCPGGNVHRDFDRLAGGFIRNPDPEHSVQRIVLGTTPDGRAILQDTNTSAVDLIRARYTVGTLPQQTP